MNKRSRHNVNRNRFSMLFPILTIVGIGIIVTLSSFYEKSWTYDWNGFSEITKDSVLEMKKTGYTGGSGQDTKVYERLAKKRLWILNNATDKELLKLIKYPDGTVKAMGYEGLIRSDTFERRTDLILQSITDNEYKVYYQMGCMGEEMAISEYLIQFFLKIDTTIPPFPPESIVDYGLSYSDKEKILTEFHNRKKNASNRD